MSMSLFDISSLIGLPCTGEEIFALLTRPLGIEYNNKDLKPSFLAFVRFACDQSPTKKFIPLVNALALAPVLFVVPSQDLLTYDLMFKDAIENKKSFEECFGFFASLHIDRLDANFTVFLNRSHGPPWYKADI
ncbi:hypothetical protein SLEP1_g2950 [Rubroshorea leprosula]|uniref:Uncharacterized protein n=1 Tax=Rubroshorea leprosula TaxID=152421 RepID=A0AAV5HN60_9ROSI|nr:hypothetical protein SLEP1_g2950 [Rubroshorea leprosula]